MSEKLPRTICALFGGGAMIYLGLVTQEEAITEFIDFNTLGLLAGMMILISVVKKSGFFQVLALWALKKSKGHPRELLVLLSISSNAFFTVFSQCSQVMPSTKMIFFILFSSFRSFFNFVGFSFSIQQFIRLSRNALKHTVTLESAIAAAAHMGETVNPE